MSGLHHDPETVQIVLEQTLVQGGTGQLETPRAHVRDGGHLLDGDPLAGFPLNRLEHAMLARFGQRDRGPLPAGPPHPSDAVHVGVRRGRDVVVHHVGEVLDIEPARGHIGGYEQIEPRRCAAVP